MGQQRRRVDPFLKRVGRIHGRIKDIKDRDEFQARVRDILLEDRENFYALGEVRYLLNPSTEGATDWRVRDINRLITRHREDRPIEDARWWARLALLLAGIALASALVSAVADLDEASDNLATARAYLVRLWSR